MRTLSGFNMQLQTHQAAFDRAMAEAADSAPRLIGGPVITAERENRAAQAEKARARGALRFGQR